MSFTIDERLTTEVLIVGGGAAGIRAAVAAQNEGSGVTLLEKGSFSETGSSFTPYALGWGYRAAKFNSVEDHYRDILEAGLGLTDKQLANTLAHGAPDRLKDLQSYGVSFKKADDGELSHHLGCFGNRSYAMLAYKMKNIKCTFYGLARSSNCDILDNAYVMDLEKNGDGTFSALVQRYTSDFIEINAKAVVLASGGAGAIYEYNLNQPEQLGDGFHLGLKLGARAINMEFIQFIYGVTRPHKTLIPQTLFQHLPRIYESEERRSTFIENYLPPDTEKETVFKERAKHGPFSTRSKSKHFDIAIFKEMNKCLAQNSTTEAKGRSGGVVIDLEQVQRNNKGKGNLEWLKRNQIDPLRDNVYIAPCAHAFNGGLYVDTTAETEVGGLFAAGEVLGGPHGADRLGGDAMATTQVFGEIAGRQAARRAREVELTSGETPGQRMLNSLVEKLNSASEVDPCKNKRIRKTIRALMWNNVGIVRTEKGLTETLNSLENVESDFCSEIAVSNPQELADALQTEITLEMAKMVTQASLMREESRGPHYREDYPQSHEDQEQLISISREGQSLQLEREEPH